MNDEPLVRFKNTEPQIGESIESTGVTPTRSVLKIVVRKWFGSLECTRKIIKKFAVFREEVRGELED